MVEKLDKIDRFTKFPGRFHPRQWCVLDENLHTQSALQTRRGVCPVLASIDHLLAVSIYYLSILGGRQWRDQQ
ncbi:hypothetical protein D8S78_11725 [Natrialba swarupiae]|nr:hypothetical protein [Natrialba swarupiae]